MPQSPEAKGAADASNDFGSKLLSDLALHHKQQNIFISPLSIFAALTMAETGAAGKTRDAMRRAMAVPASLDDDALHHSTSAMVKSLKGQKDVEVAIANALWSDNQRPLKTSFVQECRELYDADATSLDFNQAEAAADTINKWVSQNTREKITSIVDPGAIRASKAVLTNAVYFKGTWQQPFPKSETKDGPFHLADGKEQQTPFMHLASIKGAYRNGDGFEAAVLGYEGTPAITMVAVLPTPGNSPEDILAKIPIERVGSAKDPNDLDLRLPRFTLDYEARLRDPLSRMGMTLAFSDGADFSLMAPRFAIGDVLHKTRLEVDEEGTVAAAATAITMRATAVMREPPKKVLVFDRPFAVVLYDTQTGTVLFAGVIYDPHSK